MMKLTGISSRGQKSLLSNTFKLNTSSVLYSSCEKLPLEIFIDCLLDNRLELLIIEGAETKENLEVLWNKIYVEYCQLSQGESHNEILELIRDINDINAKVNIVNNIVRHLQISFDQDLINILNSLALQCDITNEDEENELIKKLNKVVARMKKWFTILKQKERSLEKLRNDNTGKTDRAYFDEWLDILSEQKGYHVDEKITVARFCRAMSKLREQANRNELKQMSKNK